MGGSAEEREVPSLGARSVRVEPSAAPRNPGTRAAQLEHYTLAPVAVNFSNSTRI